MARVKVDYNKNTDEYFAHTSKHYIKGPDYGRVCELVELDGGTPKATLKAQKAHEKKMKG